LGSLVSLQSLVLQNNAVEGLLPTQLAQCQNLIALNVGVNNLNGTIPSSLGLLSNLQALGLYSNQFTGLVPTSLASLQNLSKSHNRSRFSKVWPLLVLTCAHSPRSRMAVPL
jgi:Leucine-rich repeat (LRR) protein